MCSPLEMNLKILGKHMKMWLSVNIWELYAGRERLLPWFPFLYHQVKKDDVSGENVRRGHEEIWVISSPLWCWLTNEWSSARSFEEGLSPSILQMSSTLLCITLRNLTFKLPHLCPVFCCFLSFLCRQIHLHNPQSVRDLIFAIIRFHWWEHTLLFHRLFGKVDKLFFGN